MVTVALVLVIVPVARLLSPYTVVDTPVEFDRCTGVQEAEP